MLVRPDGSIDSPLTLGVEAIRALVARAVGAPALTLPRLDGKIVASAEWLGRSPLLLAPLCVGAVSGRTAQQGGMYGRNPI